MTIWNALWTMRLLFSLKFFLLKRPGHNMFALPVCHVCFIVLYTIVDPDNGGTTIAHLVK